MIYKHHSLTNRPASSSGDSLHSFMKTAVIYARYSSDNQTEQSIEGQLRVCQQYAKANDMLIIDTYIDRAMTGTNDMRPDFQRMIKDSNKQQFNYVIVYKLDRFSRNRYESAVHKQTLKQNNVKVMSAMENIPDSPEGVILESLLEGMNQYYSLELAQKVSRGMKESCIKGNFIGGRVLFGYDVIDKKIVVNEEERAIVESIFADYANGFTINEIAHSLKEKGIKNKRNEWITTCKLYRMIGNKRYIGLMDFQGEVFKDMYPQIIDNKVWKDVQEIREKNKNSPGSKKDAYEYILSGKLVCGYCKNKLAGVSGTSKTKNIYYYYECLDKKRNKTKCEFKATNKFNLEDLVINHLWNNIITNDENKEIIVSGILKANKEKTENNLMLKSFEKRLALAKKSSTNLIKAIEQGIVTEQTKERLKELEQEIIQMEIAVENEKQNNNSYLTRENILEYFNHLMRGNITEYKFRKRLINTFIKEIIVYKEKLIIVYRYGNKNNDDDKGNKKQHYKNIERQIETKSAFHLQLSSNRLASISPIANYANSIQEFVFFINNYFVMEIDN